MNKLKLTLISAVSIGFFSYTLFLVIQKLNENFSSEVFCGSGAPQKIASIQFSAPKPEEKINYLQRNENCLAQNGTCKVHLPNGEWISFDVGPKPVKSNQPLKFTVTVSNEAISPDLLDLTGINLNMGYLRPKFKKTKDLTYEVDFSLPFCEEDLMKWQASVILENKNKTFESKAVAFYFAALK